MLYITATELNSTELTCCDFATKFKRQRHIDLPVGLLRTELLQLLRTAGCKKQE